MSRSGMLLDARALTDSVTFPFSRKKAPNRLYKAATTERLSTWNPKARAASGVPTEEVATLYARYGEGEPGLIVTGAIAIDGNHIEAPGNSIISFDMASAQERLYGFEQMALQARSCGSLVVGQLNHPGRQTPASLQPRPISASAVQLLNNELHLQYNLPRSASLEEISIIVAAFTSAVAFLDAAGFDGVQINAAHGYLISQFLSPGTNLRQDAYGGSLEGRSKLLLDIVRAIRSTCRSDFLLSVKLNCIEYQTGAVTIQDVTRICVWLEAERVDMIEISGGTYEEFAWKHKDGYTDQDRQGYFLRQADEIKPFLSQTLLYTAGGFRTSTAMKQALSSVDGIGMARALCQQPTLCKDILNGTSPGTKPQALDQDNYNLTCMLAGTQMRQLARGEAPLDGSRADLMDEYLHRIPRWLAVRRSDGEFTSDYGWMNWIT